MMAVAIGRHAAPARMDHERPKHSNHAHHVAQDLALVPAHGGFVAPLRNPKSNVRVKNCPPRRAGGLAAIPRCGSPRRVEQFRPDDVLAALTAVERKIRNARMVAPSGSRQKRRIFIVGVGAGMQHARRGLEALQQLHETRRARVVDRADLRIGSNEQNRGTSDQRGQGSGMLDRQATSGNARGTPGINLSAFSVELAQDRIRQRQPIELPERVVIVPVVVEVFVGGLERPPEVGVLLWRKRVLAEHHTVLAFHEEVVGESQLPAEVVENRPVST